ncbi:MAG: amidase, partial [Candidatus Limnocylindria bacterium]
MCLTRLESVDERLHSFITVNGPRARDAAATADREIRAGLYRGPLHGIPYAVKDVIATKGLRTTAGSKILADHVPDTDSAVVERLDDAGAILLGKTHTYEFACGPQGGHPSVPQARNPWDLSRIPGGSSSGSASATAAGLCPIAIGTCTGGSIRLPAALCGVVGLKPTYGRVSRYGVIPLSWSLDHVGPLGRTVADCAAALAAIAGPDVRDPTTSTLPVPNYLAALGGDVRGLRLGVVEEMWTDPIEPDVRRLAQAAVSELAGLGLEVETVSLPLASDAVPAVAVIMASESAQYHSDWLRTRAKDYGPGLAARLMSGLTLTAPDLELAHRVRRLAIQQFQAAMRDFDLLVSPTAPITAPPFGGDTVTVDGVTLEWRAIMSRFTRIFNLVGMPSLSLPCGFAANGMPVGLQLAA